MSRLTFLAAATASIFVAIAKAQSSDVPVDGAALACYSTSGDLKPIGTNIYQTQSLCSGNCAKQNYSVWATTQGNLCYCGDDFPSTGEVDYDTNCNVNCLAWPSTKCGGLKAWSFGLTDVGTVISMSGSDSSSTSSSTDSSSGGKSSVTSTPLVIATTVFAGSTITATAHPASSTSTSSSSSPQEDTSGSHSSSSAGIAAGAVVGVIAVVAIAIGGYLFVRRRRRIAAEEEYRAAVSAKEFTSSVKKPVSDHRLDPVMLQQRRLSDGSIADNQDYSRRILKVINPDGN